MVFSKMGPKANGFVRSVLPGYIRRPVEPNDRLTCLAEALEFRIALCNRACDNFRPTCRVVNVFRSTNLVAIGKDLHPCRDIRRLAEIIEPLVERDCDSTLADARRFLE